MRRLLSYTGPFLGITIGFVIFGDHDLVQLISAYMWAGYGILVHWYLERAIK